jgi:DNA-binding MarR family transcriptional regulator
MNNHKADKKFDLINDLGRKFSDTTILLHENIAAKVGLSGADHKYLGILMQSGAITAGEFSNLTGLTTGAVTGVIDRLEKKNLVKREFDKNDRRKIMIVPNHENAMKILGGIFTSLQERMVKVMASFTDEETEIIEKYLYSTIEAMNDVIEKIKEGKKSTNR